MKLSLNISRVADGIAKENFSSIQEKFKGSPLIDSDLVFQEKTLKGPGVGILVPHNLKYIPRDLIITSQVWSATTGTLVTLYGSFDNTNISFTVSGIAATESVTIRYLVGRIGE